NPSATDITVTLGFTNGTTTNGDYTTTPVTVTFLAGATTATATVPTTQDAIDELDETFTVAITSTTGTVGATTDTAIGTIEDNDNAPVVTIADASITEGGNLSFAVTLSNPSATDITVTLGFTNGTTTNGDYTTTPVTVTFLAGATTATATVPTTQDAIDELDETFTVAITSTTGTVGATTDTAIGTIEDNDNAPVVTIADASITEGGNLSFAVTLSNPSATDITVTLGFTNGTTTNRDYTTTPVTVTFLAGATTATATVPTTQDAIDELDETFTVAITSTTGTVGATTDTAIGTIEDNDNAPVVTGITASSATEGTAVVFDFALSNPSAVATTYTFTLTNGTAGTSDYTTTDVTVTVPAGATTGTVSVPTTQDTIDEADETFTINNGAVSATGTIVDNDNAPTVTGITPASATEGSNVSFNFTLSNPSAVATTYTFTLTNGTAGDLDYTTTDVTVTVPAGATTGTVSVPTTQDTIDEADETFTINNGAVSATGTIVDNDNAPTVTGITASSATEGAAVVFDFALSNPSAVATTYTFTLTNGTAGSADYTTTDVTVTVPAGATTGTVSVPTTQDTIDEADETFTINNGAVSATGTIVDNDDSPNLSVLKAGVFKDENGDGFAQVGETISYTFIITNTGNTVLNNVTVTDSLPGLVITGSAIASLGLTEINSTAYSAVYTITQLDINFGKVTNQAIVTGLTPQLVLIESNSNIVITILEDEPKVEPACTIKIFNAVSPNGDGNNDVLRIDGIECYPENTVEIYNRWGVLVFERNGYNNEDKAFIGISEGRVTVNKKEALPVGTYYYIFKYKDQDANSSDIDHPIPI
ncbi:MAG: Calx-beta domain-containing protein, partial [Flavobacterium sp.]|nr:Calx-beta domain-containing protein [Flavobacterium sp.]